MVYVTLEPAEEQESKYSTSSGLTLATEVQKQGGMQWIFLPNLCYITCQATSIGKQFLHSLLNNLWV